MGRWARSRWRRRAKRAIDASVAGAGLVALSPLLGALAALGALAHRGSPLFTQERPGLGGRPFRIVKFRTMTDARGEDGAHLPDAERLTRFGRLLRSTSLDELPELYNVLRGDMSLVGPRPLLMQYLPRYSREQARRHDMPPGITGLAQISGRNALDFEDRFTLDVRYVDEWSLTLDAVILAKTAWIVARREGIHAEGSVSMPEFRGTQAEGA